MATERVPTDFAAYPVCSPFSSHLRPIRSSASTRMSKSAAAGDRPSFRPAQTEKGAHVAKHLLTASSRSRRPAPWRCHHDFDGGPTDAVALASLEGDLVFTVLEPDDIGGRSAAERARQRR